MRARNLAVAAAAALLLGLGLVAAVAWRFSTALLTPVDLASGTNCEVLASDRGHVILTGTEAGFAGLHGLRSGSDTCVVGEPIEGNAPPGAVRRPILEGRAPPPGLANLNPNVWFGDPAERGLAFREVQIPSPLGDMPAWRVDARPDGETDWVVLVHGWGNTRAEALRILPLLHDLGFTTLSVSVRNDPGAPPAADRLSHLGDTEWQDVEAAVSYAEAEGARRIVLFGWSMGGGTLQAFLRRSVAIERVRAVILDSPALELRAMIQQQLKLRSVPTILAPVVEQAVQMRTGFPFDDFDVPSRAFEVRHPTLVFLGAEDTAVPHEPSRQLAALRSERVRLVEIPRAGHVRGWNVDSVRYESEVRAFLASLTP